MNTFSNRAIKGICKLGDIFLPENGEFPKYSDVAGTHRLNDLVEYAPKDDFQSLNLVLIIFSFLPNFILKMIANKMVSAMTDPGENIILTTFRQMNMGIRGLLYSTYYSELTNPNYKGKTPLQVMDYTINRVVD